VSLAGKTAMPALIDTHVHFSPTREALRRDLKQRAYSPHPVGSRAQSARAMTWSVNCRESRNQSKSAHLQNDAIALLIWMRFRRSGVVDRLSSKERRSRADGIEGFSSGGVNRASTAARVLGARLDRLDLQARICQSKDIRIQCIALALL
jgi:hypothetical protein